MIQSIEQQVTEIKYKQLYTDSQREIRLLKARCVKLTNEVKILNSKIYKGIKTDISAPIQRIKDVINEYFNVEIDVKVRQGNYVRGRVIYYFILRSSTPMSYRDIGDTLVTRHDHASIIHAINNHHDWMEYDRQYKKDFNAIMEILNTQDATNNND
jgi:chromosomal replication initiation ATPase DnaA